MPSEPVLTAKTQSTDQIVMVGVLDFDEIKRRIETIPSLQASKATDEFRIDNSLSINITWLKIGIARYFTDRINTRVELSQVILDLKEIFELNSLADSDWLVFVIIGLIFDNKVLPDRPKDQTESKVGSVEAAARQLLGEGISQINLVGLVQIEG